MCECINYEDGFIFESDHKTLDELSKEAQSIIESEAECNYISDKDIIRTILTVLGFDEPAIERYVENISSDTGQMCINGEMKRVRRITHIDYTYEVIES